MERSSKTNTETRDLGAGAAAVQRPAAEDPYGDRNPDHLRVGVEAGVATVTIRRPPRNALTGLLVSRIAQAIDELARDEAVRAIVLTGGLRNCFCSGGDLDRLFGPEMSEASESGRLQLAYSIQESLCEIERCPKPLVAAVNGIAIGGGVELALVCDFRVASELAHFTFPELRHHIVPGMGATQRLARIVGLGRAKEMLMLGRRLRAPDANAWGLVHLLAPHREVLPAAQALAGKLGAAPTRAFTAMKQALHRAERVPPQVALVEEARAFASLVGLRTAELEREARAPDARTGLPASSAPGRAWRGFAAPAARPGVPNPSRARPARSRVRDGDEGAPTAPVGTRARSR